MFWWMYPVVLAAGIGAGVAGSVAGLASLVSYPVLLAVGLPPVTANVSNTVALVFGGAGSVAGSGPELAGRSSAIRPLALASITGGIVGGLLLLVAPANTFKYTVPWLIAGASAAILLPRRPQPQSPGRFHQPTLLAGTALIGVYGGYFGAAAGVLLLALLLSMTNDSFAHSNATKNVLTAAANAVAALAFIFLTTVRWLAVAPLALGFLIGGRIGPAIVRKAPPASLKAVIAVAGLGLATVLGWQAYR
jgi:uncharacterized membrane protein YfcA